MFAELYGLETVALRYFNVYGPRQRPDATYAAVIPLFVDALLNGRDPVVHGDGLQSRDFTFISDVVAANLAAAAAPAESCAGHVVQHRRRHGLDAARRAAACSASCSASSRTRSFVEPRAGDVRHSRADPTAAARRPRLPRPRSRLDDGLGHDRRLAANA